MNKVNSSNVSSNNKKKVSETEWTTSDVSMNLPGIKQTASGTYVVSLVVEIASCSGLQPASTKQAKVPLSDPYVKVKLAKPNTKKQHAMADIHKTKSLEKTNDPHFSLEYRSSFVIDGMLVQDLYESEGLLFKVKHAKDKADLGSLIVPPKALLEASGQTQTFHLTTTSTGSHGNRSKEIQVPTNSGSMTIRCRPAEKSDIEFYKYWGYGYFKEYAAASVAASIIQDTNNKQLLVSQPDTDESENGNEHDYPHSNIRSSKKSIWKMSVFGSTTSPKAKGKSPTSVTSSVVAPSEAAPTIATMTNVPVIAIAPSTDDTVDTAADRMQGLELNQALQATPEQLEVDETAIDPIDKPVVDALLGRAPKEIGSPDDVDPNNTKEAEVVAVEPLKTRQVDTSSGNNTTSMTTTTNNNNSEKVDVYKAGEVEDLAEAASIKKAGICPNDCFAGDCAIL